MSNCWQMQEEIFLRSVEPEAIKGKTVPDGIRIFAFLTDGSLSGIWFGRETVGWKDTEIPATLLMVRSYSWILRFAVLNVFPACYPKRPEKYMLGACASVDVRPGAGLLLHALHQETGFSAAVKYRDVYPVFQPEMEDLWRSSAQQFCGGSAWPRSYWLSRKEEIIRSVQEPVSRLLIRHGLFPVSDIRLDGLAPVAVSRP